MIRNRLENWGRAYRDTNGTFGHCRSIEHRYVPDKSLLHSEQAQEEQVSKPPAPDLRDAEAVNLAWKKCSLKTKKLLKWSFCMGRVSDEMVCRRCGMRAEPPFILARAFYQATKEIERMLDDGTNGARITPDNSSSRADTLPPATAATHTAPCAVRVTPKETEEID